MTTTLIPAPEDEQPERSLYTPANIVPTASHAKTAADQAHETSAAAAREKAVNDAANRTWHGLLLKPWSEERQRLLDHLTAADIPCPDASTCDDATFYHGMFSWAVKALYLALHEPRDWEPLRPRLLAHIEAWGAADHIPAGMTPEQLANFEPERENVPGHTLADKAQAVNLVVKMVNAHRQIMAQRSLKRRSRGPAYEGN